MKSYFYFCNILLSVKAFYINVIALQLLTRSYSLNNKLSIFYCA